MVDHSRGVVSWVRPTMQLNRHRFEAQHGSKTELRSCFCVGYVLKLGQFENDSGDERRGQRYTSILR